MRALLLALLVGVLSAGLITLGVQTLVEARVDPPWLGGELFTLAYAFCGLAGGLGAALATWLIVRTGGGRPAR